MKYYFDKRNVTTSSVSSFEIFLGTLVMQIASNEKLYSFPFVFKITCVKYYSVLFVEKIQACERQQQ